MVVAESRYLAEDAAELVSVDIEPDDAGGHGGGRPWPKAARSCTGNSPTTWPRLIPAADQPGLDRLLATAPHVFTETFAQHRYVCVPMETRGLLAQWDPWAERLELFIAGQGVHAPRLFYSRMLGVPEDDIRIVMRDVGGSFGQKAFPARRGNGRRGGRDGHG